MVDLTKFEDQTSSTEIKLQLISAQQLRSVQSPDIHKMRLPAENGNEIRLLKYWTKGGGTRYNFATGMWCDDDNTRCEDYSENPG